MTSRDFAYWLQGFFEIAQPVTATAEQVELIKKHLNMVFVHEIDPSHGGPEEQAKLNAIHGPAPGGPITSTNLQPGGHQLPGGALARC